MGIALTNREDRHCANKGMDSIASREERLCLLSRKSVTAHEPASQQASKPRREATRDGSLNTPTHTRTHTLTCLAWPGLAG